MLLAPRPPLAPRQISADILRQLLLEILNQNSPPIRHRNSGEIPRKPVKVNQIIRILKMAQRDFSLALIANLACAISSPSPVQVLDHLRVLLTPTPDRQDLGQDPAQRLLIMRDCIRGWVIDCLPSTRHPRLSKQWTPATFKFPYCSSRQQAYESWRSRESDRDLVPRFSGMSLGDLMKVVHQQMIIIKWWQLWFISGDRDERDGQVEYDKWQSSGPFKEKLINSSDQI